MKVVVAFALTMIWPVTAAAQVSIAVQQPVQATPAGVACLGRSIVDASGTGQQLTIYVPAGEASTYQGLGFAAGACDAGGMAAYRAETCRLAHLGNDAVQARLEQILGAKPKDLCDSVQRAAPFPVDVGS